MGDTAPAEMGSSSQRPKGVHYTAASTTSGPDVDGKLLMVAPEDLHQHWVASYEPLLLLHRQVWRALSDRGELTILSGRGYSLSSELQQHLENWRYGCDYYTLCFGDIEAALAAADSETVFVTRFLDWSRVLLSTALGLCHAGGADSSLLNIAFDSARPHSSWYQVALQAASEAAVVAPQSLRTHINTLHTALHSVRQLAAVSLRKRESVSVVDSFSTFSCFHAVGSSVLACATETHRLPPAVYDPLTTVDTIYDMLGDSIPPAPGTSPSGGGTEADNAGSSAAAGGGASGPPAHGDPPCTSASLKSIVASYNPGSFVESLRRALLRRIIHLPEEATLLSSSRLKLDANTAVVHAVVESCLAHVTTAVYAAVERYPSNAVATFSFIPFINDTLLVLQAFDVPFPGGVQGAGTSAYSSSSQPQQQRLPPPQPVASSLSYPHNVLRLLPTLHILIGIALDKLKRRIEELCSDSTVKITYATNPKRDPDGTAIPGELQPSQSLWDMFAFVLQPIVATCSKLERGHPFLADTLLVHAVQCAIRSLYGAVHHSPPPHCRRGEKREPQGCSWGSRSRKGIFKTGCAADVGC